MKTEIGNKLRAKLKEVSKGEPETWGFVAMFMDMIAEAEKDNKEPTGQPEWIKVSDRLPEDGQMVLTWNGYQRTIDRFREGISENFVMSKMVAQMSGEDIPTEPTHWQPLPEPPKE